MEGGLLVDDVEVTVVVVLEVTVVVVLEMVVVATVDVAGGAAVLVAPPQASKTSSAATITVTGKPKKRR